MVEVGSVVEGTITSVMPFGAFVELGEKQSGLVHISEISSQYVKDINDCVKKGDTVKVKIIKIDDKGRINLSIKQAEEKKERKPREKKRETVNKGPVRPADLEWNTSSEGMSLDDMLSKFKQDSDEKMQSLRRSNESKRSGGYSRRASHSY